MARKLTGTLILSLVLGLTSITLAQGPPNGIFGVGAALFDPSIQKELKLSDEQVGKLKDALAKVMAKYKGDFEKFQKKPPSPEEGEKIGKAFHDDSMKAIASVLDAKQMKRFKQILWQSAGSNALLDPEVQKELKLSDEQKKKLTAIIEEAGKKFQALVEKRQFSEEKHEALRKETEEKANAVLSEEQQKQFKELKGPKFEFPRPVPPPAEKR
jgi:hypothetical protein